MKLDIHLELLGLAKTSLYVLSPHVILSLFVLGAFLVAKLPIFGKTKGRNLPPGPPTWPIIGNLAGMVANRPTSKWIHRVMSELQTEIACFRFAGVHVITVISDEISREAFKDKDEVFADRPETYSSGLISGGFKTVAFSHYGDQWKKMRRVMTSEVMSPRTLNMLLRARIMEADNLLAYVHNLYVRSKTVDVRDITLTYAYPVTMRMMFGRRPFKEDTAVEGGLGPMEKDHINAIFDTLNSIFSFGVSDYVPCLRGRGLDPQEKKAAEVNKNLMKFNDVIVDQRIEFWKEKGGKDINVEDWLDILVTMKDTDGKPLLTPEEIKAQNREIASATIDNPTNNVEWTLAEMLNRPEIMRKAVDELDKVVGRDRLVQESDMPNLNYVKACCRESFRLHPVVPFVVPHVAITDTSLAGYFVPKGSHLLVSRVGLGRNPKIWEDPLAFRPERHLTGMCAPEVNLLEPEMRFVSFSAGRRGCVGSKVGIYMTVMLLARLLQGFSWSLPPGSGPVKLVESETSMFMAKPLIASVEPRLAPHMYPKFQN